MEFLNSSWSDCTDLCQRAEMHGPAVCGAWRHSPTPALPSPPSSSFMPRFFVHSLCPFAASFYSSSFPFSLFSFSLFLHPFLFHLSSSFAFLHFLPSHSFFCFPSASSFSSPPLPSIVSHFALPQRNRETCKMANKETANQTDKRQTA